MPAELSRVLNVTELLKDTCQNMTKIIVYIIYSNVKLTMDSLLREISRTWVVRSNPTGSR